MSITAKVLLVNAVLPTLLRCQGKSGGKRPQVGNSVTLGLGNNLTPPTPNWGIT